MTSSVSEIVRSIVVGLVFCLALAVPAGRVLSQDASEADRAAARELGREGLVAMQTRDYVTAVDKLSRALSLYKAPTLYLARARARVAMGRLVAGAEDLRQVVTSVAQPGESQAFTQARTDARNELEALEPRIPRLSLTSSEPLARVFVNGAEWPKDAFDVLRPLDPGSYVIEAIAVSGARANQRVELRPSQAQAVQLTPLAAAAQVDPASAASAADDSSAASASPVADAAARVEVKPSYTAAYVSGAVTVALLAGAIVSGVIALDRRSEYEDNNRPDVPMNEKESLKTSATTWAWVNTGLAAAALAGAGLTTYLFVSPPEGPGVALRVGLRGQF